MKSKQKLLENINSEQMDTKATNGEIKHVKQMKNVTTIVANTNSNSVVITSIFQFFKDITHEQAELRNKAALQLLQHICKLQDVEKQQKEIAYTVNRLVRGCGATTNKSRSSFYTALTALLKTLKEDRLPLQPVFEAMQKELHVGKTIKNKEGADALVGKILVCSAILHSGRLANTTTAHFEEVITTLIEATRHRTYHASLAYAIIVELVDILDKEKFESVLWPALQQELVVPWSKQTLQTIHCMLALIKRFPDVVNGKFFKAHFGHKCFLNADSFEELYKIFWQHSNIDIIMHPAFELFGEQLAQSAELSQFWQNVVDVNLKTPTKLSEVISIKIATDILLHVTPQQAPIIVDLLGENFIKMLIAGLKRSKQKKDDSLKAFYTDFLDALVECCTKELSNETLVTVIRRLVLPPGIFSIEKYTNTRIIHQLISRLSLEGVKEVFELYKNRFLSQDVTKENEMTLNMERVNAGYMLQHLLAHKSVQGAYDWRLEQLRFLFRAGIFHINEELQVCKKDAAGLFSKEFGEQCKRMFYASMQSKMHDLVQEKQMLVQLALYAEEQLHKLKWNSECLRIRIAHEDVLHAAWRRMYDTVAVGVETTNTKKNKKKKEQEKPNNNDDKLQLVFHILLLNMGLQLFCDAEMSVPAIDDLLKCMQRTETKEKHNINGKKEVTVNGEEEEPEWIEVVMDLLLHLLSLNSSTLRNIVNALFPHLCSSLNLNAVNQILSMLDMKDNYNPLSSKNEEEDDDGDDDDDDEQESDAEEKEDEEQEAEEEQDNEDDDDDDDDEDDDDEDEDEELEVEDDEEISPSDVLRNAISKALMSNGALPNGEHDDDMDSVDLNDLTEEEGNRLDESLAAAFKAIKSSSGAAGGGGKNAAKKSKSYRLQTTTVMHFRIRVLDLLEIYLQQSKPQLLVIIEIMLAVFNMLEHCVGEELTQLRTKAEKLLHKLIALKNCNSDNDLHQENLEAFMRTIVEKRVPAAVFSLINVIRNKCISFLFQQVDKVGHKGEEQLLNTWREFVLDYVRSRNPIVNATLWCEIFGKLRWSHLWELMYLMVERGINSNTRIFRRIQIFEILAIFYRNNDLQRSNPTKTRQTFMDIEKIIQQHLKNLTGELSCGKRSPKEFQSILEILLIVKRTAERLSLATSPLLTADSAKCVQQLRRQVRLESMQIYQQFCRVFKQTIIKNSELVLATKLDTISSKHSGQNGTLENDEHPEDNVTVQHGKKGIVGKAAKKRKQSTSSTTGTATTDTRKEKKHKKAMRLESSSKGLLNGEFSFSAVMNSHDT